MYRTRVAKYLGLDRITDDRIYVIGTTLFKYRQLCSWAAATFPVNLSFPPLVPLLYAVARAR